MLFLTIRINYSNDHDTGGNSHTMTCYLPDPDWLTVKAIADDDSINGITSFEFRNDYYFPDAEVISCKWVRNPNDTDTTITINSDDNNDSDSDDSDDESELDEIIYEIIYDIIYMDHDDFNNHITINYDSHWDCYCKTRRVCGCGCDTLHDGW